MEGLFNPVTIMLHVLNTAVLFVALYFLLYRPVRRFLDRRRQGVLKDIEDARNLKAQADAALAESRERLNASYSEAISKAAKIQEQAAENAKKIVEAAKEEAERIIQNAHKAADEAIKSNEQAMRDFAASLAVDISAKILGREITDDDNLRLIDDFLKEVK